MPTTIDTTFETIIPREKVGLSPSCGSIEPLEDGRLMWVWGYGSADPPQPFMANFSSDGGRTWSDPTPLKLADGSDLLGVIAPSLVRLGPERLGLALRAANQRGTHGQTYDVHFHVSDDEGRTWSQGVRINGKEHPTNAEHPAVDGLVRLSTGRLVLPMLGTIGPTPAPDKPVDTAYGSVRLPRHDHGHRVDTSYGEPLVRPFPQTLHYSTAYYSDDDGQTWTRSHDELFASVNGGAGGLYSMHEPQIVELADGRLLMLGHAPIGRMFRSYSEDGGASWWPAEVTDLVLRVGPFALKRLPDSEDVLVIWPQLSRLECLQGLYRHRLTCAVSRDGGLTWGHHRNLISLDDVAKVEPSPLDYWAIAPARQPLDRVRYHRAPGPLRNDHPYCTFHQGRAIIVYGHANLGDPAIIEHTYGLNFDEVARRFGFERVPGKVNLLGNNKLHILPLEWFYAQGDGAETAG